MNLPGRVQIVEVGPRDGLQNEPTPVPLEVKKQLVTDLANAGLTAIEVSSFVNPDRVPQLADAEALFAAIERRPGVRFSALVPNERGMQRAMNCKLDEVAVFTAASESFCQRNIGCSISESLNRFAPVFVSAKKNGLTVRAYISCIAGCPYEGHVEPAVVADLTRALVELGAREISLGDTIGAGTPGSIQRVLDATTAVVERHKIAVHFHDTRGQALANVLVALAAGIEVVDSAVAGLGGCPYAEGATGNLATEDLVYMLNGMGIETGVDLARLIDCGNRISAALGRTNNSRVGRAGLPKGMRA